MTDARHIDELTPSQMANWLEETAANMRRHRELPYLTAQEMNLAPHVAFRLEQAANMLRRLDPDTTTTRG